MYPIHYVEREMDGCFKQYRISYRINIHRYEDNPFINDLIISKLLNKICPPKENLIYDRFINL